MGRQMMTGRDLRVLFEPNSIAVVGASNNVDKWGYWLARAALKGTKRREVLLVNRSGGVILGQPAYTSLSNLPIVPELLVTTLPLAAFEQAINEALALGVRGIVAINSGFAELGSAGRAKQEELV